jgi:protein SCO1/2
MPRLPVAAIVLAGVMAGIAASQYFLRTDPAPPALERATLFAATRTLPKFALIDHAGRPFGPERLRGQWTFLLFGFVNCPDVCPTTLATLAAAQRSLADLPGDLRPAVALVSVDPGRDTPDVLARYVTHFDPSFIGVTGTRESIDTLAGGLGVAVMIVPADADGVYSVDHSAAIFLVNPGGRVAALFSAPHEAGTIARDYRRIAAAG